jgi:hypothetical protein
MTTPETNEATARAGVGGWGGGGVGGWGEERVFLVDGFPRNMGNMEGWKRVVGGDVTLVCVCVFFF